MSSVVLLFGSPAQSSIVPPLVPRAGARVPAEGRCARPRRQEPGRWRMPLRSVEVDGLFVHADHDEVGCVIFWLFLENDWAHLSDALLHSSSLFRSV